MLKKNKEATFSAKNLQSTKMKLKISQTLKTSAPDLRITGAKQNKSKEDCQ